MRTGRPPEEGTTRVAPVCSRFTNQDVQNLDAVRGSLTRSQFIRAATREKIERER